jgi:hypothetical protein
MKLGPIIEIYKKTSCIVELLEKQQCDGAGETSITTNYELQGKS